ncbi:MAG: hypothetical protein QW794_07405 [Thermosphaera sp.]
MKDDEALLTYQFLAGISSILFSIIILLILIVPLYFIDGIVKGFVSFSSYYLRMYNTTLKIPELDKAASLSIPITIHALITLSLGLNAITNWMRRRHVIIIARLMFATGLSSVFSTSFFYFTHAVYIKGILDSIGGEYVRSNSAGTIFLGNIIVQPSVFSNILLSPLPVLLISFLNASFSTLWTYRVYRALAFK